MHLAKGDYEPITVPITLDRWAYLLHIHEIFIETLNICIIYKLLIQAIILKFTGVYSASKDVEDHLAMGKKLLAAGQLAEALSHYHAAVGKIIW